MSEPCDNLSTDPTCSAFRNVLEDQHVPKRGRYHNALVEDSANEKFYMYDACGSFVEFSTGDFSEQAPVQSVNSKVGNVVLTANDLDAVAQDSLVYNVKDHGAIGNDIHDDTTSIQAAINAANTAGGGIVFVPKGIYKITAELIAYTHVMIVGAGSGAKSGSGDGLGTGVSVIHQTNTGSNGISGLDVFDFKLRDITFRGPGSGIGTGMALLRSFHGDSRYVSLSNVVFEYFGQDGIEVDTLIVSSFTNVVAYHNGRYGFNLHGTSGGAAGTSTAFNSCWADTNGSYGWLLDTMVYCSLNGCASDRNTVGYLLNACQGVTVDGCGSEANTVNGFQVDGDSYNVNVRSMWNFHNAGIAYLITGSSQNITLENVHENTPLGGATASIKVDTGSRATIIAPFNVTPPSYAPATTQILDDGSGNMTLYGVLNMLQNPVINMGGDVNLYRLAANKLATDDSFQSFATIRGGKFIETVSSPPASASATGEAGQIEWDSGFIYVCVATNTWKRVAIATW
jgi:hypothetical protein